MIIFMICIYILVSLFIGCIAYATVNPYGHITKSEQWKQTITIGFLWPFMLVYMFSCWIYYDLIKK